MDFINDMQQETAYDTVFTYPDNLTAPLTFSLWETEVEFYEAMQKLYKMRNTKGEKGVAKVVDTFSLSVGIRRGWPRAMPLHLLIGYNYLKPLLSLSPMGLWLLLDIHSQDMKWAVVVLKFYFGSEQAYVDAKAIFDGKNANLVAANPSGYMAHPLTIRDPHGGAVRNLEGRIRKEKIQVPFFNTSKGPMCLLPHNFIVFLHTVTKSESMCKAPAPQKTVLKHESCPHARFLQSLTPNNPESTPSLYPTRGQHQEGLISLQQAIACAIQHGNQRLQQRRHRSVLRFAVYVRQIICTPSSRVQITKSIPGCWRFKCQRVAIAPNGPIRHGVFKLLLLSVNSYYNTTKVEVYRWVLVPIRKGGLRAMSLASKLFWSMSGISQS